MVKRQVANLANALLQPINPAMISLLGIYTVIWGLWLANPFWTVFTQAPLYSAMSEVAPEWVWGGIAIAAGIIIVYGASKRSYDALTRGALTANIHWLAISVMYFMGDPLNTGGITALFLAVYAGIVYLNTKINYRRNGNPHTNRMVRR